MVTVGIGLDKLEETKIQAWAWRVAQGLNTCLVVRGLRLNPQHHEKQFSKIKSKGLLENTKNKSEKRYHKSKASQMLFLSKKGQRENRDNCRKAKPFHCQN